MRAFLVAALSSSLFFLFPLTSFSQLQPPQSNSAGNSYYTSRLEDAKAIYLRPDNFPVKGDGAADDSAGLQQAIDAVQEKMNQGILFIPAGRYRITKTIYIWPGIRMIGFGAGRPTLVLVTSVKVPSPLL
jgi:hypothetical protein